MALLRQQQLSADVDGCYFVEQDRLSAPDFSDS